MGDDFHRIQNLVYAELERALDAIYDKAERYGLDKEATIAEVRTYLSDEGLLSIFEWVMRLV